MNLNLNYTQNGYDDPTRKFKRNLIVLGVSILVIVIGIQLYSVLDRGRLIVNTDGDSITITSIKNSKFKLTATNKISTKLVPGQYLVAVLGSDSVETDQTVNIKIGKTVSVNINPLDISPAEAVTSFDASDISVSGSKLYYLNGPDGDLFSIDSSSQLTDLGPSGGLQSVQWSSTPGDGAGQSQGGQLYAINNGSVSLIQVPEGYGGGVHVNYSVAPNDGVYVSFNSNVYYASSPSSQFNKIYTSISNQPILDGYDNKVAVISPDSDSNSFKADDDEVNFSIISSSGSGAVTSKISVNQSAWSPDGQHFAVAGTVNAVLDGSNLKQVATLPITGGSPSNLVWLNNNELLYGLNSDLWLYNIQNQKASKLTDVSNIGDISQLTVDQNGTYVYALVQSVASDDGYQMVRFGLTSSFTGASAIMQQLQVFLPATYGGCYIGYVDFVNPTILTTATDSTGLDCQQQTTNYLGQYNVSTSNLNFGSY